MMSEYLHESEQKKPEDVLQMMKQKLQEFKEDPLSMQTLNLDIDRDRVYSNLIDDKKRSELLELSIMKGFNFSI